MAESLRDLPIYNKKSFTQFIPHSRSNQSRVTYVSTSNCNNFWVIDGGRQMLYDLSLDQKRTAYRNSVTNVSDGESPPIKMPRLGTE